MSPIDSPYTRKRYAQFRGPSTSDDYNRRVEEYYQDLITLTNRTRLAEVELDELQRRHAREQTSMLIMIEALEDRLASLEGDRTRLTFFSHTQIDVERFDDKPLFAIPEVDRLSYDTQYGFMTLPKVDTSSLSKLFFVNTDGEGVVPPSLETRVVGNASTADNPSAIIEESRPELAVYRKPGMIWERNVVVEVPNSDGAELTLYVKVPTDLFTTDRSNAIVLHPYPSFGTTIREVSYTLVASPVLDDSDGYASLNSGSLYAGEEGAVGWVPPGGWTGPFAGADAAMNSGPKLYYFPALPITGLRIRLHQPNRVREEGRFVYSYGLSHLDLRYDKFLGQGRTIVRFDAPAGQTIDDVINVQPEIWNVPRALVDEVFSYRAIWETSYNSGEYTFEPVANSARVWIEVTLKAEEGQFPALTALDIEPVMSG